MRVSPVVFGTLSLASLGVAIGGAWAAPADTAEQARRARVAEEWPQLKGDARHSGAAADRSVKVPLGLVAAVPLSDAVFTSPVVAGGRVFVVDGSGVAWAFDTDLKPLWRFESAGGKTNVSNVSSPAVAGRCLHFGTMAGNYYVLDAASGEVVKTIACGEPIFSAPIVSPERVYFVTLGSRVHAIQYDGTPCWTWDFVRERLGFDGDRWNGEDWRRLKKQATWREQFLCSRDAALDGKTLVIPAGGQVVWLEDRGDRPEFRGAYLGQRESPATLGLSIDADGAVYRQWTQRDNNGRVEILRLRGGKIEADYVRGTETSYQGAGSLGFSSVSFGDGEVYRTRPEEGFALCLHAGGKTESLGAFPAIAPPIVLKDHVVCGGLDGALHVVPRRGQRGAGSQPATEDPWSFQTPFKKPISAPAAVADGRIYFGGEDGYLYVLGPNGSAPLPSGDLGLERIRSPLGGKHTDPKYDWFTSFGNWANTNTTDQGLKLPLRFQWFRRYEGTAKHFSVCGGGRMYTHTAEGQVFAVEQETGRLLWRRYFPGVHVSYTSPLYYRERLLVPQAGLSRCRLRCLDAATGKLLWEAPFTGSPSWNRQIPPIVYKNLAIYPFSSGRYTPETWLFEHQSTFGFPADQKPLVRAWDLDTGKEVWTRDFSEHGAGGDDAGMCLMDGVLYYSCYFGKRKRQGVTAALDPATGRSLWTTTEHAVHAGCTVSGKDGRLYLGGYNPVEGDVNRVWCLSANDGSLVWKSEPVKGAIHVVTIGDRFVFAHAQYQNAYLIDRQTGKILSTLAQGYRCTRFTYAEPYLVGPNADLFDLRQGNALVSSGPQIDVLQCIGAIVSNGRIFFTTNGAGVQCSLRYGEEARP